MSGVSCEAYNTLIMMVFTRKKGSNSIQSVVKEKGNRIFGSAFICFLSLSISALLNVLGSCLWEKWPFW